MSWEPPQAATSNWLAPQEEQALHTRSCDPLQGVDSYSAPTVHADAHAVHWRSSVPNGLHARVSNEPDPHVGEHGTQEAAAAEVAFARPTAGADALTNVPNGQWPSPHCVSRVVVHAATSGAAAGQVRQVEQLRSCVASGAADSKETPETHVLHGEQTRSLASPHADASKCSAGHIVHCEHTLSWVALGATISYSTPAGQGARQGAHLRSAVGPHGDCSYDCGPHIVHVRHSRSLVGVGAADCHSPAAQAGE